MASLSRSMYLGLQGTRRATASQAGWADGSSPLFTRGNGEEWGHCFLLHSSSWGFMSFCSMLTWLDSFCSNALSYYFLYVLASLSRSILFSKEPGDQQLPKQDEPMDKSPVKAVPCSPGGNGKEFLSSILVEPFRSITKLGQILWESRSSNSRLSVVVFLFHVHAFLSWSRSASKETGDQQLPNQDEPMDKSPVKAVPCTPGGEWGRSAVTAS